MSDNGKFTRCHIAPAHLGAVFSCSAGSTCATWITIAYTSHFGLEALDVAK